MYKHIMVPVDLSQREAMEKALATAAGLAREYGAALTFVGATSTAPGGVAHTPEEFAAKLAAFTAEENARYGIEAESRAVISHDPAAELDDALLATARELGADLVVMATHLPTVADYLWPSNGGRMAAHSDLSVFLVRSG